jgi:4-amino-4-deoxy-L-arabinose transferase-like glycosyltransferase
VPVRLIPATRSAPPSEPARPLANGSSAIWALLVFLLSALFVAWCSAGSFVDNSDEGIYLDGALRMTRGEMPYRDFFTYLGPGTFAVLAILFKIFGTSLAVSRTPVIIDLALMTALVFVLVARLAGRGVAAVTAACFLAFQTFTPIIVVANHRWDSSALSFAAVSVCFFLFEKPCGAWAFGAGLCAGLAAWTTISLALLCLVLLGWLLWDRQLRACAKAYAAGLGVVLLAGVSWLALNRALLPMIDGVLWSIHNYGGPNFTNYGYAIGGYGYLFRNANGMETVLAALLLMAVTLPATMPLLCLAGWPLRLRRHPDRRIVFLLTSGAAILASCCPRPDLTHLLYVAAMPYVLTSVLAARTLTRGVQCAAVGVFLLVTACDFGIAIHRRLTEPSLPARIGEVHGRPEELTVLKMAQTHVAPAQTLFVFPYYPMFYFTTGARNPTRYSYLQPGMFPERDQEEVLRTLEAHPADTVIYQDIAPASLLRTWPRSDPARLRMTGIEDFLRAHYKTVAREGSFQILRMRE